MFNRTSKMILMICLLVTGCLPSGIASATLNNANTDWFRDAKYGVINHFIHGYNDITGDWNDIVDNFDVDAYADQAEAAGVGYVIFTLGQNSGYYCSPNAAYDAYTGYAPGERTSLRDLPMDLYDALNPKGIKLMLYIPANPPHADQQARDGLDWPGADGIEYPPSQETMRKWQDGVIKEWSDRYGSKVAGWWVDGMWYTSSYNNMSLAQNWSTITDDLKSGNPNRIIALNPGVGGVIKNSDYEDFTAGEMDTIGAMPSNRWITGLQWHTMTFLGNFWGQGGLKNSTANLVNWVKDVTDRQGVVTLDIRTNKDGVWDADQLNQLKAIKAVVRNGGSLQPAPVNNTNAGISYTGSWSIDSNRSGNDYLHDVHYTTTNGDYFTYTFNGTSIDYITEKNNDMGNVDIYIDNVYMARVNAYATTKSTYQTLYSIANLSPGNHTIKVVKVDGTYMLLDALNLGFDSTAYYTIRNRGNAKVVDGRGHTTNGAIVGQYSDTTSTNLEWQLIDLGTGYYKIKNHATGMVLDGKGVTVNGGLAGVWSDVTSANLEWQVISLPSGYYKIKNRATGMVLDSRGVTVDADLSLYSDVASSNLEWEIK